MHHLSDEDLIKEFIRRRQHTFAAFNELVRRYEPLVYRFCLKYLRNPEQAQDITQEVFLKVHAKIEQLKNPKQFKSWVMTIASNSCTTLYHQGQRQKRLKEQVEREISTSATTAPENDNLDSKLELLKEAMSKLKQTDKDILMLHYFSELTVKEVAEQLDLGVSAVKMRLSRSREKILLYMEKKL